MPYAHTINLKPNKSSDPINNRTLKAAGGALLPDLFNLILPEKKVPDKEEKGNNIFLSKKSSRNNIENFPSISLCSKILKLFSRTLKDRILGKIMKGFSVIDNFYTVNQVIGKRYKFNLPLYQCFIDF